MKILFIGDISGRPGREVIRDVLPGIKKANKIDFVIANAENSAHGRGITRAGIEELQSYGIDFFTSGEHVWDQREFKEELYDANLPLVRPLNYEKSDILPGRGYAELDLGKKGKVVVISLLGQTFMREHVRSPFWTIEDLLKEKKEEWKGAAIIVDFHAEATSEKLTMGYFLKDKVSAVLGTHTHVGTVDTRLFESTGYVTDVGMVGPYDASLWVEFEDVLNNFKFPFKKPFNMNEGKNRQFNSVLLEISSDLTEFGVKKTEKIKRIDKLQIQTI